MRRYAMTSNLYLDPPAAGHEAAGRSTATLLSTLIGIVVALTFLFGFGIAVEPAGGERVEREEVADRIGAAGASVGCEGAVDGLVDASDGAELAERAGLARDGEAGRSACRRGRGAGRPWPA